MSPVYPVAVFVASDWLDLHRLTVWAHTMTGRIVLLTDDASSSNERLLRELRCAEAVVAVFRLPGLLRSREAIHLARALRDRSMAMMAAEVLDFGDVPGGVERFSWLRTTRADV